MASGDTIQIAVRGRGGHASAPHDCLDPIPIACEIVQAFQTLVTPPGPRLRSGGGDHREDRGGTTRNVIPDTANLLGTIRTVSEATRERVLEACGGSPRASRPRTGAEVGSR